MVALTEKLVLAKTRASSLAEVRNLNLWGSQLTDVSLVERMPNVEVLSLSVNGISSLRSFGKCPKLQELYLRKNDISDLSELRFLLPLRHLRVLWVSENPCAEAPIYRATVVRALPSVVKLDNLDVTPDDRVESGKVLLPPLLQAELAKSASRPSSNSTTSARSTSSPLSSSTAAGGAPDGAPAINGSRTVSDGPLEVGLRQKERPRSAAATLGGGDARPAGGSVSDGVVKSGGGSRMGSRSGADGNVGRHDGAKLMSSGHLAAAPLRETSSSSNVLYAVMALLNELDEDGLNIVKTEVDQKLQALDGRRR